jgi:sulfonate transport system permease protein
MKTINKHLWKNVFSWVLPIGLIIIWYLVTSTGEAKLRFPTPQAVVVRGIGMIKTGELQSYILVSTQRALLGFLLGGVIGFLLGLLTGLSTKANIFLNTTIQMFRNIPVLAVIPLAIVWFGVGEQLKIYLVAFGTFFPIYANTFHGIQSVDKDLVEMGNVYGLSKVKIFLRIMFPSALSSILVGVRLSLGIMWLVLIAAETVATDAGIGYMAMTARGLFQMDKVVLSIILYAILGKLSDVIAARLESTFLRWRK